MPFYFSNLFIVLYFHTDFYVFASFVILLTPFAVREDVVPIIIALEFIFQYQRICTSLAKLFIRKMQVENKNFCGCMNVSKFNGISRINLNLSSPWHLKGATHLHFHIYISKATQFHSSSSSYMSRSKISCTSSGTYP